jgi:hypothetical protein
MQDFLESIEEKEAELSATIARLERNDPKLLSVYIPSLSSLLNSLTNPSIHFATLPFPEFIAVWVRIRPPYWKFPYAVNYQYQEFSN